MARIPSGAVASMLENDATKNTIFFDDFTEGPFVVSRVSQNSNWKENPKYQLAARHLSQNCQNSAKSGGRKRLAARLFEGCSAQHVRPNMFDATLMTPS
jgi:hypothetical protein